jgi:5'-methylthioadenosine phosphorylase
MNDQIKIGLIGGSGLGAAMAEHTQGGVRHEVQTPFGKPSDVIIETSWHGLPVYFLNRHGPGHLLNPTQVPYRANIFALKQLGVTHILASGAVGSLREEYKPRHLVIPDQVIDKTHKRPATFFENAAVHVEFAEPFDPVLRRILVEAGSGSRGSGSAETAGAPASSSSTETGTRNREPDLAVHDGGCYVAMEGPAFSTRAESLMHRLWGGDLIGMTAMPEAKLAREAEIAYALVALVTDFDCWRQPPTAPQGQQQGQSQPAPEVDPFVLLKEIIANLNAATENAIALMRRAVELMAEPQRRQQLLKSPAHHALQLGIWSDKGRIPAEEVRRLGPLWLKYFEEKT